MTLAIEVLLFVLTCILVLVIAILVILLHRSEEKEEFVTFKKGKIPEEHDELLAYHVELRRQNEGLAFNF